MDKLIVMKTQFITMLDYTASIGDIVFAGLMALCSIVLLMLQRYSEDEKIGE